MVVTEEHKVKLLITACLIALIGITPHEESRAQEKITTAKKAESAKEVGRILKERLKPLGLVPARQQSQMPRSPGAMRLTNKVDELTRKLALDKSLEKVAPLAFSLPIPTKTLGAVISLVKPKTPAPPMPPAMGTPNQGTFSNHPMGNVPYRSFSANGVTSFQGRTDTAGNYRFNTGDTVALTVAGVDILVPAGERINPSYIIDQLFPSPAFSEQQRQNAIINLSTFLQSMDGDGNLENGIGVRTDARVQGISSPLNKAQFADQTPGEFSSNLATSNQANSTITDNMMPLKPVDSLLALANYFRNELSGAWVGGNASSPSLLVFDSLCPLYEASVTRADAGEPCFSNLIDSSFSFNNGAGPIVSGPYSVYAVNIGIQARVTPSTNGTVARDSENNGVRKFVTAVFEESLLDSSGNPTGKTRFDIVGFYFLDTGTFAADEQEPGLDPAGLINLVGSNLNLTWDYRYSDFTSSNPSPSSQRFDSENYARQEGIKNTLRGTWSFGLVSGQDPINNCSRPKLVSNSRILDARFAANYFDCETGAATFGVMESNAIVHFGLNNKYLLINAPRFVNYGDYVLNGNSITITSIQASTSAGEGDVQVGQVFDFGAPVNNDVTRFSTRSGDGMVINRVLSLRERTNQFKPTAVNNTVN
jgi:hypothetical protein